MHSTLNGVLPLYCPISLMGRDDPNSMFLPTNVWTQKHFTMTRKYLILTQVNKYAFFVKLVS